MSLQRKVQKGEEKKLTPKQESEERINVLSDYLFKATQKASVDVQSDFTMSELNHCFLKLMFQFNKRNLDQEQEHGIERQQPSDMEVVDPKTLN